MSSTMQENDTLKNGIEVFISYAKEDSSLRARLSRNLRPLEPLIDVWCNQEILPGRNWEQEIVEHLEKASLILLLISAEFIDASMDPVRKNPVTIEMQRALERHKAGEARVIPILLQPCFYKRTPFYKLQPLPTNAQAITTWADQDLAFVDVAEGIDRVIEELMVQLQPRKIEFFGYEMQDRNLWRNPKGFSLDKTYNVSYRTKQASSYLSWFAEKRAFTEKDILNMTWLKAGDHGYSFTVQFLPEGKLLESPLLDQGHQLHGSWEILDSGVLQTKIVQDEGGTLVPYEIDVHANRRGITHSGIESHGDTSASHAYFVFLPLQPSDTSNYLEKALLVFEQLLRVNPDCVEAYNARGDIFRKLKQYEKALSEYQRVIGLNPEHTWVWYNKGDALWKLRQLEEAVNAYKRSIELTPTFLWVWYDMGEVLYTLERYEEAIAAYEQAQQLAPNFADLPAHKGNALYCLQRYKEALDAYEQALHLGYHFPDSSWYEIVKGLSALAVIELLPLQHENTPDGKGQYWRYPEKSVYWSPKTGIHATEGTIHEKWASLDWERGLLGYPVSDQAYTADGIGLYQHFQKGSIFVSPSGDVHAVDGIICEKWASLDWERGALGYPTTDTDFLPDKIGRHCHFQHGCIYWSPETGAHEVHGLIREKWEALGWEQSFLGYPTRDEKGSPDGIGRISNFQHGSIYWTPETGAHAVHSTIYKKWGSLNWERGFLGYPIADDKESPDGIGRISTFQHGRIYWTAKTGAYTMQGEIGEKWATLRWEQGILRYPVSDQEPTEDDIGLFQHFQRGSIFWSPETGAREVYGAIRDRWKKLNWERGVLGYPTTGEMGAADGKGRYNHFQHGSIYYHDDADTSAHEIYGAIRERWAGLGWEQSTLGYPITGLGNAPDTTGQISYFQQGALYLSESGEIVLFKGLGKNLQARFKDQPAFTHALEQVHKRRSEELSLVVYHIDHPGEKNVGYYRIGKNIDVNGVAADGWGKLFRLNFLKAKEHQGVGIALVDLDGSGLPAFLIFRIDHDEDKNRGYYRIGKHLQANGTVTDGWQNTIRIPDPFGKRCQGAGIAVADLNNSGRPDLLLFYVVCSGDKKEGFYRVGRDLDTDGLVTGGWGEPIQFPGDFGDEQDGIGMTLADLDGNGYYDLLLLFMEQHEDGKNYGSYRVGKHLDGCGIVTGGWEASVQIPGPFGTQTHGVGLAVTDLKRNGHPDLVVFSIEHHRDHPTDENNGYYRIGRSLDTHGNATGGWTDPLEVPGWFGTWNQGVGIALTTLLS